MPRNTAQPQGGAFNDPLKSFGIILLLVAILSVIVWRQYKNNIRRAVIDVVAAEQTVQGYLSLTPEAKRQNEKNKKTLQGIKTKRFRSLKPIDLVTILSITGRFWLWPSTVLLVILGILTWRRSIRHRYRRKMDFEMLLAEQSKNFACTRPFLKVNPSKMSATEGPWRFAETYREFATRNRLLLDGDSKPVPANDEEAEAMHYATQRAAKIFAAQLGPAFRGYEQLEIHEKAIFAIHLAQLFVDREACNGLSDQINTSYVPAKGRKPAIIDTKGADEIVAKYAGQSKFLDLAARHFHVNVLLVALREEALKAAGVYPPSEFVAWMRPTDRTLWYSLHQVRMRVAHPEAAGVRAHYLAEIKEGVALSTPCVNAAVRELRQALCDEGSISLRSPDFVAVSEEGDSAVSSIAR